MMRSFREVRAGTVALCVLMLAGAQAVAASSVALNLELGGDNHTAEWKAGTKVPFSGGSPASGQTFAQGGNITWCVKVVASGTQGAGAGAGSPIYGAANVVFNLELRDSLNNLVTVNPFKSTINDNSSPDVLAAAAFAVGFNVGGPGRCVDAPAAGGPWMGGTDTSQWKVRSATYPKALNGQLLGMGAGYSPPLGATKSWVAAQMKAGVGMTTLPNSQPGLGIGPVCEGQIDASMLAPGSYTLTVIPRPGINVLRGDVDLTADQNAFATAAESTSGSSIQFVVSPPVPPSPASDPAPANGATNITLDQVMSWTPGAGATSRDVYFGTTNPPPLIGNQTETSYVAMLEMDKTYYWRVDEKNAGGTTTGPVWSFSTEPALRVVAWRSMRTHSSVGEVAIVLDPAKNIGGVGSQGPTSEPRQNGVLKIWVEFTKPIGISMTPDIVDANNVTVYPADFSTLPDGKTLEMLFTPGQLADQQCYRIELAQLVYDIYFIEELSGDTNCAFRNLQGDASSDGLVTLGDLSTIKFRLDQSVAPNNGKYDLTLDGRINLGDMSFAKFRLNHAACR